MLPLEVVFAVDAPEENPELLIVVTPIDASAYEDWADRDETLALRLAARVVQGIYEACHGAGFTSAEVMCGGHRGLLALEVDLTGAPKTIASDLETRLRGAVRSAAELHAGKIHRSLKVVLDWIEKTGDTSVMPTAKLALK